MKNLQHVVIVPDGNRRWAVRRNLPPFFGHTEGAKRMEEIVRAAHEYGVNYCTVWGASVANLTERSSEEVEALNTLYAAYFKNLATSTEVHDKEVCIRVLGRWHDLTPSHVRDAIIEVCERTRAYTRRNLTLLIGYDGREEMVEAVSAIVKAQPDRVKFTTIKEYLWTADLPPVDLVVRTGGEPHWSAGLMMWDVAEAHLHFTDTLWPDFTVEEFAAALREAAQRGRRGGR